MTKAIQEGRQLRLEVEGVDLPFMVDPIPAKRGRKLTEYFILASTQQMVPVGIESIFIESLGAANYSRMTGQIVDQYDDDGAYVQSWAPDGSFTSDRANLEADEAHPRFLARDAMDGEPDVDGEPIRQEEGEALALCAFYWQTVVGMEGVQAFLDDGEGSRGSLKALSLLLYRSGLSPSRTLLSSESESRTQQDDTAAMSTPSGGATVVRLPPARRGFRQNAEAGASRSRRR